MSENLRDLETPALLVDAVRLEKNIARMARAARAAGVRLRPHLKAHKCLEIARLQRSHGAAGFTCAKVSEAALFARAGFDDILVAYPLVGTKPFRLADLASEVSARLSTLADSSEGVRALAEAWEARGAGVSLPVHLKVDTGLGRAGVPVEDAVRLADLARAVDRAPHLASEGLLTHAGHAHAAGDEEEVARIASHEGSSLVAAAERLRRAGLSVPEVSVGSTPTARGAMAVEGVTEVRPGLYVFHDANQVRLGVASLEDCALSVLTTVVSRPTEERGICDAGSKTLSSDRGAYGTAAGSHGIVLDGSGALLPELELWRLSEEHGWLRTRRDSMPRVGERLRVIPAHACPVVNLADRLHLVEGERVREVWRVQARGLVA